MRAEETQHPGVQQGSLFPATPLTAPRRLDSGALLCQSVLRPVTTPEIDSQRGRLCPRDGFELVLDIETARASIDAGWPAVELWRCRLGHSVRIWTDTDEAPRAIPIGLKPCAVCGGPLPPLKDRHAVGGRKYHAGPCTVFASRERTVWTQQHPCDAYVLEKQPWYHGPLYAPAPLPPLDPLAGRMPREWAAGWLRLYGGGA